jgi:glycosyltransferase involved in cell wall biosynthesis
MGTFNGEGYLAPQLDSIAEQTYANWFLVASDDGSLDATITLLEEYQQQWGKARLHIREGPKQGFAKNFLSMACDSSVDAHWYAFADQDDVWLPQKLEQAIQELSKALEGKAADTPALYGGRTAYVRDDLAVYRHSPNFKAPKTFQNALVQSMAGGNTMLFNHPAKKLLERVGVVDTPSHDWWLYQLVTGAGGIVVYDSEPRILYRQHPRALVGGNMGVQAQIKRLFMGLQGRFRLWSERNLACLENAYAWLTPDAKSVIANFQKIRNGGFFQRVIAFKKAGLYRQTWVGRLSLFVAVLLKKI